MSTSGQFNTKSPTIKRILREAAEITQAPSIDYTAAPLETNLFEWHFTIRGPPATSYEGGIYHGRIVLPPTYPLRPPSFRFLTPSGRFEPNREICLSISGHHEESWQPAWGIRTALVAIRAFMESDAKGQVGGIDASKQVRMRLAKDSPAWRCPGCQKSNADIMKDREAEVGDSDGSAGKDEEIPKDLKLGYRDELGGPNKTQEDSASATPEQSAPLATPAAPMSPSSQAQRGAVIPVTTSRVSDPAANASLAPPQTRMMSRPRRDENTGWLDMAIAGLTLALVYMVIRKLATWL